MNYNNNHQYNVAGVIRYSCALLFILFTFFLLFFLDGDLLAIAQHVFSHGVTHYSIFIGALVITLSLQLLQWVMSKIVRFPDFAFALSYVPSFLALTMLTHLDETAIQMHDFSVWWWLAPLVLVIFFLLVVFVKRMEELRVHSFRDISSVLWPNYLILMCLSLFTGMMHQASDVYMYELKAERLILQGDFEEASQVGRLSTETSIHLNNLRAYALSKRGLLAEHLFDYPQPYGSDGLLCLSNTDSMHYRFDANDICFSLGGRCGQSVISLDHYLCLLMTRQQFVADSLANVDSTYLASLGDSLRVVRQQRIDVLQRQRERVRQYFLCKLLLDKDLDRFAQQLELCYRLDSVGDVVPDSLPRAYREALALVQPLRSDTLTLRLLGSYQAMKDSLPDRLIRRNLTRRKFGDTYWWYYDFQELFH